MSVTADFDWRHRDTARWEIDVQTDAGTLSLADGGASLRIDGRDLDADGPGEYPGVYRRFAGTIQDRRVDLDDRPLIHVADAFLLGRRVTVEPFEDD